MDVGPPRRHATLGPKLLVNAAAFCSGRAEQAAARKPAWLPLRIPERGFPEAFLRARLRRSRDRRAGVLGTMQTDTESPSNGARARCACSRSERGEPWHYDAYDCASWSWRTTAGASSLKFLRSTGIRVPQGDGIPRLSLYGNIAVTVLPLTRGPSVLGARPVASSGSRKNAYRAQTARPSAPAKP